MIFFLDKLLKLGLSPERMTFEGNAKSGVTCRSNMWGVLLWAVVVSTVGCCVVCDGLVWVVCRRTNCTSCLSERNECAWCEETDTCFPFVEYMMRYVESDRVIERKGLLLVGT